TGPLRETQPRRHVVACEVDGDDPDPVAEVLSWIGSGPGLEQAEAAVVIPLESFQHVDHHRTTIVDVVTHGSEGSATAQQLDKERLELGYELLPGRTIAADDKRNVRCEGCKVRVAQHGHHIPPASRRSLHLRDARTCAEV